MQSIVLKTIAVLCLLSSYNADVRSATLSDDIRIGTGQRCPSEAPTPETAAIVAKLAAVLIRTAFDFTSSLLSDAGKEEKKEVSVVGSANWFAYDGVSKISRPTGCIWIARGEFRTPRSTASSDGVTTLNLALERAYRVVGIVGNPATYIEIKVERHGVDNLIRLSPNVVVYNRPLSSSWGKERGVALALSMFDKATSPKDGQPFASTLITFNPIFAESALMNSDLQNRATEWLPGYPGSQDRPNEKVSEFGAFSLKAVVVETRPGSRFLQALARNFDSAKEDLIGAAKDRLIPSEREKVVAQDRKVQYEFLGKMADARYTVEIKQLELAQIPSADDVRKKQKELEIVRAKLSANEIFESAGYARPYQLE